jgi:hypothetical protein
MKKVLIKILTFAALLTFVEWNLYATTAHADGRLNCTGDYNNLHCGWTLGPDAAVPQDAEDRAIAKAREEAWVARCKPTIGEPGDDGMRRYHYAAKNCEFGE